MNTPPLTRPPRRLLTWLRPRRITLRARLTLVYGGLFLAAGVVLLAVTHGVTRVRVASPYR